MNLKQKTVSGLKWSGLQQAVTQILTFIFGLMLMKLLTPEDYGIIAMVTVFSGFLTVFQDIGLTTSLIQKKEIYEDDKQAVFWSMFIISVLLGTALFLCAPAIANFYNEDKVLWVARAFSLNFFISALGTVDLALYKREFNFKVIALTRISAVIVGGVVAIYCAYGGFEYWSIVIQIILANVTLSFGMLIFGRFRPKIKFNWKAFKYHFTFGFPLLGSKALIFVSKNSDKILIGKFLTKIDLGNYTRAYNLLFLPIHQISLVFTTVLYSSFSKMQERKNDVANIYCISTNSMIFLLTPFLVLFYFNTEFIVLNIFGDKWFEIIDLLQIFVFLILFHFPTILRGNINISQGHTKKDFRYNIFSSITNVGAVLIGVSFGIKWIAINLVIAALLQAITSIYFVSKSLDQSFLTLLKEFYPSIMNACLLFLVGYSVNVFFIQTGASDFLKLFIEIVVFLTATISIMFFFDNKSFKLIQEIMFKALNRS